MEIVVTTHQAASSEFGPVYTEYVATAKGATGLFGEPVKGYGSTEAEAVEDLKWLLRSIEDYQR